MYNIYDSFSSVLKINGDGNGLQLKCRIHSFRKLIVFSLTHFILSLAFSVWAAATSEACDPSRVKLTGNIGGIVPISMSKNPVCDELEHILPLLVGHFFALVAVVTPASLLSATELFCSSDLNL